jgi:hypothetical protein
MELAGMLDLNDMQGRVAGISDTNIMNKYF